MDLKEKAGNVFEREALRRELQAMLSDYLEDREVRALSWNELLYIFLTSAVFGSLVESLWCRVSNGFWERRTSVLFGDLSFAEAIGGTFLTVVLRNDLDAKPGDIFVKSLFWGTVLEYIMSWGEETFTGYRSWDYSDRAFNLNGRVCADTLIPFGLLGLGMIYFVKPFLFRLYGQMSEMAMQAVCIALLILFLTDTVISSFTLLRLRRHAAALDGDSTEAITHAVRSALSAQPVLIRRILRAFPDASIYNRRVIAAMKERRKRLENEIKETKTRAKTALELREKNLQDTLSQYAEKLRK